MITITRPRLSCVVWLGAIVFLSLELSVNAKRISRSQFNELEHRGGNSAYKEKEKRKLDDSDDDDNDGGDDDDDDDYDDDDDDSVVITTPSTPDDHLVLSLPFLEDGAFTTRHFAGLLPVSTEEDRYLFYWLFEPDNSISKKNDDEIPLVIWLNGGPGCSSMDGLFIENGPFRLDAENGEWKIKLNPFSWHMAPAYVLFVDQPAGTGLSFTKSKNFAKNDREINEDFYGFLVTFLKLHRDKFLKDGKLNRPLYFSGESYAGRYIPNMMDYILDQNKVNDDIQIPLSGAAIGNGWMDPYYQYAGAEAAYGHGIIDLAQKAVLDKVEKECQETLLAHHWDTDVCDYLQDSILSSSLGPGLKGRKCSYDLRLTEVEGKETYPKGHWNMECYLGGFDTEDDLPDMPNNIRHRVLKSLHATAQIEYGHRFQECSSEVYWPLMHQDGKPVVPELVRILEEQEQGKIRVLLFNGIWDFSCNHAGNEAMLQNLPWKNRENWIKATRYAWLADIAAENGQALSGYMKEYDNLLFLKIMDSGHMVPMDVPDVALEMMQRFMYNMSFSQSKQQLDRKENADQDCPDCNTCEKCAACDDSSNDDDLDDDDLDYDDDFNINNEFSDDNDK